MMILGKIEHHMQKNSNMLIPKTLSIFASILTENIGNPRFTQDFHVLLLYSNSDFSGSDWSWAGL